MLFSIFRYDNNVNIIPIPITVTQSRKQTTSKIDKYGRHGRSRWSS